MAIAILLGVVAPIQSGEFCSVCAHMFKESLEQLEKYINLSRLLFSTLVLCAFLLLWNTAIVDAVMLALLKLFGEF